MIFACFLIFWSVLSTVTDIPDQYSDGNTLVWKFKPDQYCDGRDCPNFYYGAQDQDIGILLKYHRVTEMNSTWQTVHTGGNVPREINQLPLDFLIKKNTVVADNVYNVFFNGTLKGICNEKDVPGCNNTHFSSLNWYVKKGSYQVNGVTLNEGDVKMSFVMQHWPFEVNSVGLRVTWEIVGVNLRLPVTAKMTNKVLAIKEDRGEVSIDFGGKCVVDESDVTNQITVTMEDEILTKQRVVVHVDIPKGDFIDYDPKFSCVVDKVSSSFAIKISMFLLIFLMSFV